MDVNGDHLGNIRLSYADRDNDGVIDIERNSIDVDGDNDYAHEILEENNYYPFGLKHKGYNNLISSTNKAQDYKFNGIELEQSLGLDLYEMELRQYDPAIARWIGIDPVTHFSQSTYNGFDNNPIYWADPSGADATNLINDIMNNSTGNNTTWTNNGDGTFSGSNGRSVDCGDECSQEGQTRESKRVVGQGHGAVAIDATQYYHSGGINGSKAGWYFEDQYAQILQPIAEDIAGIGIGYAGSVEWLSNIDSVEGFENFLLAYSGVLAQRAENHAAFMRSGYTRPMGFDSPFFMGALGLAGKALGFGVASEWTTVGRWMSEAEYNAMKSGTTVLEGAGGQTFVTQGGSNVFPSAARGSIYAEFQVPTNSLLQGGRSGWYKLIGPNASRSQQYLLQKQGGQLLPQYRNLSRILEIK